MTPPAKFRLAAKAMAVVLSFLLTGCFISPGKFASELEISQDGAYTFSYEGEIFFIGLSKLAQMGAASETLAAEACYDDNQNPRECSEAEIAKQRTAWAASAEDRAAKARKDAQELAALMGGIDPTDPEAAIELRRLLLRHKGWHHVEYKGDGIFDVAYSASGQLSHDMLFPVIEGFPTASPFIQVILREDNLVRINAPGFAIQDNANFFGSMMGGMAGLAALGTGGETTGEAAKAIPPLDGIFTIVTDGQILANNTDEGAAVADGSSRLEWRVDQSTRAAPTALVRLAD